MLETLVLGSKAPDFSLKGTDGKTHSLSGFKDKDVLVVIFACNHCPYVQAYEDRLIELAKAYEGKRVQFIDINSNEDENYPEDSFPEMVKRAKEKSYPFPYLRDETQEVAKAYGATHTPHLFVFDRMRNLRYTGKIDDNWRDPGSVRRQYLKEALDALTSGQEVPEKETQAIGCTIKWLK